MDHVYATLAVRLSHSGLFRKVELWKNAVTYTTTMGGTYGIFLRNIGEGRAELTLFFDAAAREETRFHFEEFVRTHLERKALPNTLQRRRIFICPDCGTPLDDLLGQAQERTRFQFGNLHSLRDKSFPPGQGRAIGYNTCFTCLQDG